MSLTRFKELKRSMKLCHNTSEPKKEQLDYNPTCKYNLIYQTIVYNTNAITKYTDKYQVVDEITWSHTGYRELGSRLTERPMNKKVNFSGQTTIMTDSCQFHPHAIIYQHKLHPNLSMTRRETTELKYLFLDIEQMLIEDRRDVVLAT